MKKMKIGIVGIGMVGTPTMNWFLKKRKWFFMKRWERGKNLFCYDADPKKGYSDDVSRANIIFICVPTPSNPDGSCNISIVESVIRDLPDREDRRNWCIVIKSTVPPGTTANLQRKYKEKGCFLFNPEFLTEARSWEDFIKPDRQIVGVAEADDEASQKWAKIVLNILPAIKGTLKICGVPSTVAEITKYAANEFGATKVSFFNRLYLRCRILGVSYDLVRQMVIGDKRIGPSWSLVPYNDYFGYGGFCFIKDTDASIAADEKLLDGLEENDGMVFLKAIDFSKAMRSFNEALLASQGLTPEDVCRHDKEIEKILKEKQRQKKGELK